MSRPDDIKEEFVDEEFTFEDTTYPEHRWTITWKPVKRWTFDQYGSTDEAWNSEGTITLWKSDDYNCRLIIETWKGTTRFYTYVDQWGTYYFQDGDPLYIASEENTRSFWMAFLDALKMFSDLAEFKMKPPTEEDYS